MSGTRRWLVRRTVALLSLTAVTVATLLVAYTGVHGNADPLRTRTSPAILEVAAARAALHEAHTVAVDTLGSPGTELVGTGGDYRSQIAVANQSLTRAAEAGVAGEPGLRQLQTVAGLIVAYTGWIEQAEGADNPQLRGAYLYYAGRMRDGIIQLLDDQVQRRQIDELSRQASPWWLVWSAWLAAALLCAALLVLTPRLRTFPRERFERFRRHLRALLLSLAPPALWLAAQVPARWLVWSAWLAAVLLCTAVAALLWRTQRSLRRRFRRRGNPWLAAAGGVLGATLLLLMAFTAVTVDDMTDSQRTLDAARSAVGEEITRSSDEVNGELAEADWRVAVNQWIWLSGPVIAGLILWGMLPRVFEYRYQER